MSAHCRGAARATGRRYSPLWLLTTLLAGYALSAVADEELTVSVETAGTQRLMDPVSGQVVVVLPAAVAAGAVRVSADERGVVVRDTRSPSAATTRAVAEHLAPDEIVIRREPGAVIVERSIESPVSTALEVAPGSGDIVPDGKIGVVRVLGAPPTRAPTLRFVATPGGPPVAAERIVTAPGK